MLVVINIDNLDTGVRISVFKLKMGIRISNINGVPQELYFTQPTAEFALTSMLCLTPVTRAYSMGLLSVVGSSSVCGIDYL